jgi:hypothetical protein
MRSRAILCTSALVLAVLFKFWLIAGLPITDDPDDPPNYVAQMLHDGPSFFGPGTGLAGWTLGAAGIPFRLGMEIAYLLACLLAVRALFGWPTHSFLAVAVFVFAAFDPTPAELLSHVLSDPVWMIEVILGLALLVLFAIGRSPWRWLWLAPAALVLALSTITRTTILPLSAALVFWVALVLLTEWRKGATRRRLELAAGTALVLAAVALVYKGTCWHNAATFGYDGLSLPDSREYRDFYMCLQSVGEPTGARYYPVDTARLDEIAQAGPVSRAFVEAMKTDANFRRISEQTFGQRDFALGWFHFVVFFNTIPGGDLRQGFAMFQAVENEIATAAKEGRIKTRAILPLPDCRLGIVAGALPGTVIRLGGLIPVVPPKYAWAGDNEPRFDNTAFTVALRRGATGRSPLREKIGAVLCALYAPVYWLLLPVLALGIGGCAVGAMLRRGKLREVDPEFPARQLFLIATVAFFAWNAIFCASGVPFFARYMILQQVLLPLLAAYYARLAWTMARSQPKATQVLRLGSAALFVQANTLLSPGSG